MAPGTSLEPWPGIVVGTPKTLQTIWHHAQLVSSVPTCVGNGSFLCPTFILRSLITRGYLGGRPNAHYVLVIVTTLIKKNRGRYLPKFWMVQPCWLGKLTKHQLYPAHASLQGVRNTFNGETTER